MGLKIAMVVVDAEDSKTLAAFWQAALDARIVYTDDTYVVLRSASDGPALGFQTVPEKRAGKNRLHLDVHAAPGERRAEADRLVALGATIVDERTIDGSSHWITMTDPEGNEFCIADHG